MDNNLYRLAAKENYLFKSPRGMITVSDLFDLPLEGNNSMNLDRIAQSIDADIAQEGKQSFVKSNTVNPTNANKMEIIKDIIAEKLADKVAKANAKEKAAKKAKLLEILSRKQDASLESKTEAEILAELQALDS